MVGYALTSSCPRGGDDCWGHTTAGHHCNKPVAIPTFFSISKTSAGRVPGLVSSLPLPLLFLLFSCSSPLPVFSLGLATHPVLSTAGDTRENWMVLVCFVTAGREGVIWSCVVRAVSSVGEAHESRNWSSVRSCFSFPFASSGAPPTSSSSSSCSPAHTHAHGNVQVSPHMMCYSNSAIHGKGFLLSCLLKTCPLLL